MTQDVNRMSGQLGMRVCPFSSKNRMNFSLISELSTWTLSRPAPGLKKNAGRPHGQLPAFPLP
jgi:hypothetical protein